MLKTIILMLISSVSLADPAPFSTREQCGPDLSGAPGMKLVRDQGADSSYCMAYAIATILSFYEGHDVSAMELVFNTRYNQQYDDIVKAQQGLIPKEKGAFVVTGDFFPEEIIETANSSGYCSESKVISTFSSGELKTIKQAYLDLPSNEGLRHTLFPGTKRTDLFRKDQIAYDIMKEMSASCVPHRHLSQKMGRIVRDERGPGQFSFLNQNQPGIVVLENNKIFVDGRPNNHAVVLLGRRWNAKKGYCEYIARDSGGPNCSNFSGSGLKCENGNVIIPEQTLISASIQSVQLIPEIQSSAQAIPAASGGSGQY